MYGDYGLDTHSLSHILCIVHELYTIDDRERNDKSKSKGKGLTFLYISDISLKQNGHHKVIH